MLLISRLVSDSSGVPLAGLRVRVTRLKGNTPCPFALTETGNLIHDGNAVLSSTGTLSVWVTDDRGARITVFNPDNTVAYQEDVHAAFEATDVEVSNTATEALPVPIPVRMALGFKTVTLAAAATRTVDVIIVYSDGSIVRNPSSGVVATTTDNTKASVNASTRTITAVATGSATIQFTYTLGYLVVSDSVVVTVS